MLEHLVFPVLSVVGRVAVAVTLVTFAVLTAAAIVAAVLFVLWLVRVIVIAAIEIPRRTFHAVRGLLARTPAPSDLSVVRDWRTDTVALERISA